MYLNTANDEAEAFMIFMRKNKKGFSKKQFILTLGENKTNLFNDLVKAGHIVEIEEDKYVFTAYAKKYPFDISWVAIIISLIALIINIIGFLYKFKFMEF